MKSKPLLPWRANLLPLCAVFGLAVLLPRAGFAASITTQPQNQSALAGSNAVFTVVAGGQTPLHYRWSFNGTNLVNSTHIGGATNSTLTVSNITASDAGNYRVVVTNVNSSATSSIVTLTVLFRPSITNQPQNLTTYFSGTATFSVTAGGTASLKYRWRFGGVPLSDGGQISGATNATLNVANVQAANFGNYSVVVTNNYGSITSVVATLNATNRVHYVNAANPSPAAPYTGWSTAATNIQDAVDASVAGDSVLVTNGIYNSGGHAAVGANNCVAVAIPISITSVSGPTVTIIDGGAANRCIYLTNGAVLSGFTLTNGTTSEHGGGARCETAAVITNCVLTGNTSSQNGGGVYQGTLTNCTLSGNSGGLGGGAAYAVLNNCTVNENLSGDGSGGYNCTFNGCLIISNTYFSSYATWGGGIYGGTANNCTLIGNHASQSGGGAYAATLSNCVVGANGADNYQGGGVDSCTLYNCTLTNNGAGQWGGNASESTLVNSTLTGGSAFMGGGAYSSTLTGCMLSGNTAYWGGGARFSTLSNCTMLANSGYSNGGGADSSGLINCLVVSNYAAQGAGVCGCTATNCVIQGNNMSDPYFGSGGGALSCTLYNCLIAANNSVRDAGGADQCTLVNCTVTANSASGNGGGVNSSWLTNCIVYFNTAPVTANYSGTNYMSWCETTPLPFITASDVIVGISNVLSVPNFVNAAGGNYRLYPGSPGINVGNNSAVVVTNDLDGNLRIVNTNVDLGAYEFQNWPFITSQPANQTVPFGQPSVSFSVSAVGPGTFAYQWRFNGTNILGATNSTLTLAFVQYSQAGNYSVVVANSFGSALSSSAVLAVIPPTPPSFATQPANQIVPTGTNVTLSASATGAPPPAYKWYFNGAPLADNSHYAGTATTTLQISNVLTNDTGNYFAVATNTGGAATSSVAAVTVLIPPAITLQPASQTKLQGAGVAFNAAASGGALLSYQWLFNGNPLTDNGQITGSATTNLTISNLQSTNSGNYVLVATNPVGSASSVAAVLNVIAPPSIVQQPADQVAPLGAGVTFSVVASGTAPLNYQWQKHGTNFTGDARVSGVTSSTLTISNIQMNDGGAYRIVVTNAYGIATSAEASLLVVPVVAWGDDSHAQTDVNPVTTNILTVAAGLYHNLGVRADGTAAAWGYDGSGQSSPPAGLTNVVAVAAGFYHSMALRSDGTVTSWGNADLGGAPTNGVINVAAIAAGAFHSLALLNDGTLWGTDPYYGQISMPAGLSNLVAVSADYAQSLALRDDGTVVGWGDNQYGEATPPAGLTNVVAVAAGFYHSLALKADGTVVGWGADSAGQSDVPAGLGNVVAIAAGGFHSLALKSDGTVVGWGSNTNGAAIVPAGLSNVVAIAAGGYHSLALVEDPAIQIPPGIWRQPSARTVPKDQTAIFIPSVTGSLPMNFQWYFNGAPLAGETNKWLVLQTAQPDKTGNYQFIAANNYGAVTSAVAVVSVVILPPAFSQQPQNQAAIIGSNATFSANVSGSQPMAYQWFSDNGILSDGGTVSGSMTTVLTIAGVQTNDAINYWLVASNAAGMTTSSIVNLTVVLPVTITQSPSSQTNAAGSTFALTVAADGGAPFGYRWYFGSTLLTNNARVSGAATTTLSISSAQIADAGNYFAVVTNLLTAATSSVAVITVQTPPSVTTQPLGRSTPLGLTNIFAAGASGTAPLSYQWRLNGTDIPGATNTSYFIAATGTNDLGVYQFVVSNAVGFAVSSNALLTVGPVVAWGYNGNNQCIVPPGLSNVTTIGNGYTYSLAARLDGTYAAWGTVGSPAVVTNSNWTNIMAISAGVSGALVLRADGSVVGSISVDPAASKISISNAVAVAVGGGFGLALRQEGTVMAWGSAQLSGFVQMVPPPGLTHVTAIAAGYQHAMALRSDGTVAAWGIGSATNVPIGLSNVMAIAGGQTHSLALKSDGTIVAWGTGGGTNIPAGLSNVMSIAAGGYTDQRSDTSIAVRSNGTVVAWGVTGFNGQTNPPAGLTNVVAVTINGNHALALVNDGRPQILRQPSGGVAWSGRDYTLQTVAAGAAPLNYQWLLNGTNLNGATNSTLLLPSIQTNSAGNYQVVVSNALDVAASFAVPVTVLAGVPFLLTQPTNVSAFLGSRVALSTAVAGSGPLQLQWLFNSNSIAGATNDTLIFDRIHVANMGNYTLLASNSFGAITSAVVKLTVQQLVNWGDNTFGATNMPANLTNVAAISANFYGDIALRNDGTITIWGNSGYITTNTATNFSSVVEVSAGYLYNLVLKTNGSAYAWGYNTSTAFSNGVASQSNIMAIAAGNFTCALLKNDGSVVRVNSSGVASTVSGLTNAISVEPFDDGFIALKADGTLYSQPGGSVPPSTFTNVLSVASSRYQGLAVKRDGKIQDWPQTLLPAGTSNIIAVAAGGFNSEPEFAVRQDGSIMTGGSGVNTNVPYGLAKVWRLDAGNTHCLALLSDQDFPPVFLHTALNTSNYVVSSKCAPQWFGQTAISHDGTNAARSAPIGNNLSSSMRTWVVGPVTVKFWWKVSSETNHDFLNFSAGGVVLTNISGEADWQQVAVTVPAGNQILQWTYAKDAGGSAGQDAAWVDQLQIIPIPPAILTQPQPASQDVVGGTNVTYNVTATGTPPMTYFWRKDGSTVASGLNKTNLVLAGVTRASSGVYSVFIFSPYGNAASSNAVLAVHVPQLLGTPAFQPDGSILLSSTDSDGGQLTAADLVHLQVQVTTNLVDWMTLSNALVLTNGALQLQDAAATNSSSRFYRIVESW